MAAETTQQIVFFRHGEKPAEGLGQLSCQGLNRALALPDVLTKKFNKPDYLFAPNPGYQKPDNGHIYNYIRPLATIEPTAIFLAMPVNTDYGFDQIDKLQATLLERSLYGKQIWISWEHKELVNAERNLLAKLGQPSSLIQNWESNEFDRIDVLIINRDEDHVKSVIYKQDRQNLNGLPVSCPVYRKN